MDFLSILSIFVLACFVGYYVVWSVTPALHTPLMSVTNAISSVIVVGALLAIGADLVGGLGGASGGQREFAPVLARAAVAVGVAGVFIETHEAPDRAPSDGPNMIPLDAMPALIESLMRFDRIAKADPVWR